jgi:hypothetical protein
MENINYQQNNVKKEVSEENNSKNYNQYSFYTSLGVGFLGAATSCAILDKPVAATVMTGLGVIMYAGSYAMSNSSRIKELENQIESLTKIKELENQIESLTKKPSDLEKIE